MCVYQIEVHIVCGASLMASMEISSRDERKACLRALKDVQQWRHKLSASHPEICAACPQQPLVPLQRAVPSLCLVLHAEHIHGALFCGPINGGLTQCLSVLRLHVLQNDLTMGILHLDLRSGATTRPAWLS